MTLNSTSSLTAAGSTTLGISPEELRRLVSQIEADLYQSQVYRRSLNNLETMVAEATGSTQMLFKAVAREAIRLALQEFVSQYQTAATTAASQAKSLQLSPLQATDRPPKGAAPMLRKGVIPNSVRSTNSVNSAKTPNSKVPTPHSKKLTQTDLADQTAKQWQECLRPIGEQLRQARIARSLDIRQLQSQTHIPLHHLEALEAGRVEALPEDVFVRGFIRRIADVLELDGAALVASLPAPEPQKSVLLPSMYQPEFKTSRFYLSPTHLYLSYTALVAGAVGGLAWISQQSPKEVIYEYDPVVPSQLNVSLKDADYTSKPGLKSTHNAVVNGLNIAPPETLSPF